MTPVPPIEDTAADIVRKAMRGLGLSPVALAAAARITPAALEAALASPAATGNTPALSPETAALFRALAEPLELAPDGLVALATGNYHPQIPAPQDGFAMFNSPFGDGLTVNNFLVWDASTQEAALFDTGTDAAAPLNFINKHNLRLREIFLTHAHPDHVAALAPIVRACNNVTAPNPVHLCTREPSAGLDTGGAALHRFEPGAEFFLGSLSILALEASGHTPGQTAFLVRGLSYAIVFVGDALFAGSMGGASVENYRRQRHNTAQNILHLPGETLLAPGHGPLSSVAFEREHNPVFSKLS
jgi:glyoxylase-like metal-dependent hydrolase (beta-lactamase superfamily II)